MPTATGLPKAGDQLYNAHYKQRFRVMSRSSNSYPLTLYIRPMPGKDFPADMLRGRRRMPDGTFPLPLEIPVDDAFRMGLSHWTNLPDQGEIEPGRIVRCNDIEVHRPHLYLRNRVWHKCHGIKPGSIEVVRPVQPGPDRSLGRQVDFVVQRRNEGDRHWDGVGTPHRTIAEAREDIAEREGVQWRILERTTTFRIAHEETGI
jgi:hypothetical protein